MNPHHKPELRDRETIRAYLEELLRLKAPVQFSLPQSDLPPFETSLEKVTQESFSTTTTPQLEPGQVLNLSFMVDARRFSTHTRAVSKGVFTLPLTLGKGERRASQRGAFERSDRAEVFAVESVAGTICGGRLVLGKLLDLSPEGLRFSLDEGAEGLKPGDAFDAVLIRDLPFSPPIQCGGVVVHTTRTPGGSFAGMRLDGLEDSDRRNIERILARRFPATFGQSFPAKKRLTDVADEPGTPTPVKVRPREAEVVETPMEAPRLPPPPRPRPAVTPVMRLRKPARKILFLSNHPSTPALAEAMRQDGFKQVFEARSFLEAHNLASRMNFDLVFLDIGPGGRWGADMMKVLRSHDLLLQVPFILVADSRKDGPAELAEDLGALHVHERSDSFEELVPVIYPWLLRDVTHYL